MTTLIDAQANLRTLRDVLRYAVTRFNEAELSFGHGQGDAFEEAAFIVMRTLKLPTERLEFFADAYLTHAEIHELLQVIDRRVKKRIPAAYLLNESWLRGYKFYVDERVLIPRSFIGELLDEGLTPWVSDRNAIGDVLDLCTGSGCLAIMAADVFPNAKVDAADISADALHGRPPQHRRLSAPVAREPGQVRPLRRARHQALRHHPVQSALRDRERDGQAARRVRA